MTTVKTHRASRTLQPDWFQQIHGNVDVIEQTPNKADEQPMDRKISVFILWHEIVLITLALILIIYCYISK